MECARNHTTAEMIVISHSATYEQYQCATCGAEVAVNHSSRGTSLRVLSEGWGKGVSSEPTKPKLFEPQDFPSWMSGEPLMASTTIMMHTQPTDWAPSSVGITYAQAWPNLRWDGQNLYNYQSPNPIHRVLLCSVDGLVKIFTSTDRNLIHELYSPIRGFNTDSKLLRWYGNEDRKMGVDFSKEALYIYHRGLYDELYVIRAQFPGASRWVERIKHDSQKL